MIQDIAPLKLYNEYTRPGIADLHAPAEDSQILIFDKRTIFVKEDMTLPLFSEFKSFMTDEGKMIHNGLAFGDSFELRYLFSVNETRYFLFFSLKGNVNVKDTFAWEREGFHFENVRTVMEQAPLPVGHVAATGFHLHTWYSKHRICGCCGQVLVHDEKERMMRCPDCKNMYFPMIAPACIIAVTNGDKENPKILLSKYANRGYTRYALLAGFIEIGETAEEAVKREVMEEVGLKVKNIRYYKTQPWGVDSNLLLGFFCELAKEDEIHIDKEELALAEWKSPSEVPTGMGRVSLTGEMMEVFVRENS